MKNYTGNDTAPAGTCPGTAEDCKVLENQFPHPEKCCRKLDGPGGADYEKICTCCNIWISPPDPSTLEVAAIIECSKYGFGKRIRE